MIVLKRIIIIVIFVQIDIPVFVPDILPRDQIRYGRWRRSSV